MSEQGKKPEPAQKAKSAGGKAAQIDKKDQTVSEEDLRKISDGIEPRVQKKN